MLSAPVCLSGFPDSHKNKARFWIHASAFDFVDEDEKSIEVNMMNNYQMTPADLALEEEEIQMLLGQ